MQRIILDPVLNQTPSASQHDQRLGEILDQGPPSTQKVRQTFTKKAGSFCASKLGIALLSGVIYFFLLLILQPRYIYKKNQENNTFKFKNINYIVVFVISLVGALGVFLIPCLINKTSS